MATIANRKLQTRICNKNKSNGKAERASIKKNRGIRAESRQCAAVGTRAINSPMTYLVNILSFMPGIIQQLTKNLKLRNGRQSSS